MTTAYLAAEGLEAQLRDELHRASVAVTGEHGRLIIADGPAIEAAWAANIWHDCLEWPVASIGKADTRTPPGTRRSKSTASVASGANMCSST